MKTNLSIAGRGIGPGQPCFVIAEAGVNHNGDLDSALALIDVAADAGADAVKFQSFDPGRLATRDAPKAAYQTLSGPFGESQYAMLCRLALSSEDHAALAAHCRKRGIIFLSTPFDEQSAAMLLEVGVAAFKIASGELTNLPFLEHVARMGLPMIVSTGMATLPEVEEAVATIRAAGAPSLALLHCTSNYPADPAAANLRAILTLAQTFGVPAGYSDHTPGLDIALASVALGACILEKHFTLDRALPGPDHQASLEPGELRRLVAGVRTVEGALGDGRKIPTASELETAAVARKSLVAVRSLQQGEVITGDHIEAKRPGTGVPPKYRSEMIGRVARQDIPAGTVLRWEMFA